MEPDEKAGESRIPIELLLHLLDFLTAKELIQLLPLSSLFYELSLKILRNRIAALLLKSELLVISPSCRLVLLPIDSHSLLTYSFAMTARIS